MQVIAENVEFDQAEVGPLRVAKRAVDDRAQPFLADGHTVDDAQRDVLRKPRVKPFAYSMLDVLATARATRTGPPSAMRPRAPPRLVECQLDMSLPNPHRR